MVVVIISYCSHLLVNVRKMGFTKCFKASGTNLHVGRNEIQLRIVPDAKIW